MLKSLKISRKDFQKKTIFARRSDGMTDCAGLRSAGLRLTTTLADSSIKIVNGYQEDDSKQ
jgi:hypothetical protein